MADTIMEDGKRAILQHILGPRGGLFALGILCGMFIMHVYITKTVVEELKDRIENLEAANTELNLRVQNIAFGKLESKE